MFELQRSSSAPDPTSPHFVYPSSLFSLDLGYALWYPEVHDPTGEPQIGDVGYIHRGAFLRLFNINTSLPEHKVSSWRPPFEVSEDPPEDVFTLDKRQSPIEPGRYPSHGVREKDISGALSAGFAESSASLSAGYTCKETQGALLVLQSQAYSETVFESLRLKRYMRLQHERWCAYARDTLGHDVTPDEIMLIGGWVKTSADWAAMAFSNLVKKHYASLKGTAAGIVGLEFSWSRTRVDSGPKWHRQGKQYGKRTQNAGTEHARDQSIFLRRYKMKRRLILLKTIVAGAGYDTLPGGEEGEGAGEGVMANLEAVYGDRLDNGLKWTESKVLDPLDTLLEYILEVSEASIAVAYDQDIESMIGHDEWPLDMATYLRKVQPPVSVQDECGTLSIPGLLSCQQARRLENRLISIEDVRQWPRITTDGAGVCAEAPVKFTDRPNLSPHLPMKWRYLRFNTPFATPEGISTIPFASSKDGAYLAGVTGELQVTIWRLSDGLSVQRLGENGHTARVLTVAFSPDGKRLVSGSSDTCAIIWDVQSGAVIHRLRGHRLAIEHTVYSPDGEYIVTSSQDSTVKFWDSKSGSPLCNFPFSEYIRALVFSANGSRFAVWMDRSVALFDTTPEKPIVRLALLTSLKRPKVHGVALSASGDLLAVSAREDDDYGAHIHNTDDCALVTRFEFRRDLGGIAFAPDGEEIAGVTMDSIAVTWNVRDGTEHMQYPANPPTTAVAFSPDGRFFAVASGEEEGWVRAWNRHTGAFVAEFKGHTGDVDHLQFLSDSLRLLAYAKQGTASLWDIGDALRMR